MFSIKHNIDRTERSLARLQKDLDIAIETSARKIIKARIKRLQKELSNLINEYRQDQAKNGKPAQPLAQKIAEEQALGKHRALVPGDDHFSQFNSPVYKVGDTGNNLFMKVRRELNDDADYEDYLNSFSDTLSEKIFAIQDSNTGKYRYYIIPPSSSLLMDVLDGVKIFCSSYRHSAGQGLSSLTTGDDGEALADIGAIKGKEKFERDKQKKFTDFTLKGDSLQLIKDRGLDVTDVVLNTQHGNYEDAYSIAKNINSPAMKAVADKAAQTMEGKGLSSQADALGKTNKIINGISLSENITSTNKIFTVKVDTPSWTSGNSGSTIMGEALSKAISDKGLENELLREVAVWTNEGKQVIKNSIQQALEKALADFNKAG